jgi:hypothetical protein
MRRVIIRFLASTAVLGGIILNGAGVAAADPERPAAGGTSASAEPTCGTSNFDLDQGCILGWGRLFR